MKLNTEEVVNDGVHTAGLAQPAAAAAARLNERDSLHGRPPRGCPHSSTFGSCDQVSRFP